MDAYHGMQLGEKPALFTKKLQKISAEEPPKMDLTSWWKFWENVEPVENICGLVFFSLSLKFDFSFLDRWGLFFDLETLIWFELET